MIRNMHGTIYGLSSRVRGPRTGHTPGRLTGSSSHPRALEPGRPVQTSLLVGRVSASPTCDETWGPQRARGSAGEAGSHWLAGDLPQDQAACAGGGLASPGGMRVTW